MSTAETSRRDAAVLAKRYWLTEKGIAATDDWWEQHQGGGDS